MQLMYYVGFAGCTTLEYSYVYHIEQREIMYGLDKYVLAKLV